MPPRTTPRTTPRTPRTGDTAGRRPGGSAARPARPRRRRALIAAGLAGVLLLALPVTDSVARRLAEERLADRIELKQTNLVGRPDVSIEGLPFLLRAARETYPEVRVRADAKTDRGSPVKADVTFDHVSREGDGYRADSASARFTAPYSSLGGGPDGDTLVSDAGNGQLLIRRTVLGAPVVLTAGVELHDGVVSLRPTAASVAGRAMDPASPLIAQALARQTRTLPELPLGLRPSGVSVGADGVTVTARAEDVTPA
ncbi:LmeA family phospholipid-binding protein [Streptomyces erythrochromogenes]|uniref:LmeA family phospholipid-binding protein n=1 Tax=Streptomyces erythrochromogenes TaxID=285574 RepID=UPI003435AB29